MDSLERRMSETNELSEHAWKQSYRHGEVKLCWRWEPRWRFWDTMRAHNDLSTCSKSLLKRKHPILVSYDLSFMLMIYFSKFFQSCIHIRFSAVHGLLRKFRNCFTSWSLKFKEQNARERFPFSRLWFPVKTLPGRSLWRFALYN